MNNRSILKTTLGAGSLLAALLALTVGGCGDSATPSASDTSVTGADTAVGTDTSMVGGDTTGVNDPTYIDPDIRCDRREFDIQSQNFSKETNYASYQARNASADPTDVLSIELYNGGSLQGATTAGIYNLDDPNYETCANCVLIRATCNSGKPCEKTFYADVGTLNIQQWDAGDGTFSGRLQGVVLREVTIDKDTFVSTQVPGGETWCVSDFAFTAEIKGIPVSDRTQPTCVAEGTGTFLHDNVKDIKYTNCLGEEVSLHATCGQSKALWLVATAGWCSACAEFIAGLVADHGGSLSRAKIGEKTPGLDMLVILGENRQEGKPSLAYCNEYATAHKLDPAMVVVDWTDAASQVSLVDPEGSYIETNALGITWSAVNPYLTADANGGVASGYPWWGLLDGRNMEYVWSDYAQERDFQTTLSALLSAP